MNKLDSEAYRDMSYLELLYLIQYPRAHEDNGILLLALILLPLLWFATVWPFLLFLIGLLLFLLEGLEHLVALPEQVVHLSFHALSAEVQEGAIHPPGHNDASPTAEWNFHLKHQ